MRRRLWGWIAGSAAAVFVLIQAVPVSRTNPPETSPLSAPEPVLQVLAKSCGDCHSNRTRWPWYAYVAPASWLVSGDVAEAREKMNFSSWGELPPLEQASLRRKIVEEIRGGEMPLPVYLLAHRDARPTPRDIEVLASWAGPVPPEHRH